MSIFEKRPLLTAGVGFVLLALVAGNLVLIVINVLLYRRPTPIQVGRSSKYEDRATAEAQEAGLELSYLDGPVALFTVPGVPQAFELFDYDHSLLVMRTDDEGETDASRITLAIGADFSVDVNYRPNDDSAAKEVRLTNNEQSFLDLNADGSYDVRIELPTKSSRGPKTYVWFSCGWKQVDRMKRYGKYKYALVNGDEVQFNQESGAWIDSRK